MFQNLELELDRYASKEYLLGLRSLPIPNNRFPNFNEISPLIENATGWSLLPVAGFLDEELFFEINTKSPYMLLVSKVKKDLCRNMTKDEKELFGIEKLRFVYKAMFPFIF